MLSVFVVVLLAFVTRVHTKKASAAHSEHMEEYINNWVDKFVSKSVDKLLNWLTKARFLRQTDLSDITLRETRSDEKQVVGVIQKRKRSQKRESQIRRKRDAGYFQSYANMSVHVEMLQDKTRTLAYKRAIMDHGDNLGPASTSA
eukprot:gnl/MRDRNA2_/MRDRNA2_59724_c0_seq3.p1 gnl/MRDRNA2_/MRDRNA2_59724_c0~~gnl/MRDRNA2_/MRDRNA2_59724_c0_seq3.p1  ORF type:complete len:145 (+),score=24.21 gnl/MRDRNA2_/MRDRNA2_59724_c0_seq3:119-553(+)